MSFIPGESPIRSVDGVTTLPAPSDYQWSLEDASRSDAGRTEDVVMHKNRIGQVPAVYLKWNGLTIAESAAVLTTFNPEYITVEYLDLMAGNMLTKEFYVGNRTAALYNSKLNCVDGISFKIIARNG